MIASTWGRDTAALARLQQEIEGHARGYGLDAFDTIFELVDYEELNEIAALGGFPTRYPHWRFGMEYEQLSKGYSYGLQKIYELVINNDPCYAYLLRCNSMLDQKLVMAHVYGHCLAPETLVETRAGAKPIRDVYVGEQVLTHTGAYRPVRAVAKRWHQGTIRHLTVAGCTEPVRITAEHPIYVLRPAPRVLNARRRSPGRSTGQVEHQRSAPGPSVQDRLEWLPAAQVRPGDYVVFPRRRPALGRQGAHGCAADVIPGNRCFEAWADDHSIYRAVRSVEVEAYDGLVYNFSVSTDESYTLTAGLVVHNCDFFKNNHWFSQTNRKMLDEMANHGTRVRSWMEVHGLEPVEEFIDTCLSIENLIDIHAPFIKRRDDPDPYAFGQPAAAERERPLKFESKAYMDDFMNPPGFVKEQQTRIDREREKPRAFPEHPERDVMQFLIEHAPLEPWQRDVLSIIREEAYYFAPQAQTKIMNEGWACLHGSSLIFTDRGLLRLGDVVEQRSAIRISDGETRRDVCDWARFADRETVWIRTRRGLELEGSVTHRVWLADGRWRRLDELQPGDSVRLGAGDIWAEEPVRIDGALRQRAATVPHGAGPAVRVPDHGPALATKTWMPDQRCATRIPEILDQRLAAFLGYLIGDGRVGVVAGVIGVSPGDEEQLEVIVGLGSELFGLEPRAKWHGGRWQVRFRSQTVAAVFKHLGITWGADGRIQGIPDAILRSPKPVVAAFLRAYCDGKGDAGQSGVVLPTDESTSRVLQLLLLNFGILSTRHARGAGCWQVEVSGQSAAVFQEEIGFGLRRQQEALRKSLDGWPGSTPDEWHDEVVAIERRRADVYDISVAETHRYAAQGLINHNSYWHSTILTQRMLTPAEVVDFADHHSGTMATSPGRLNPYKLGIELFRDIEERWNRGQFGKEYDECDDHDRKQAWDLHLGKGRDKIFEVRRIHNDVTFIDTFLTPEFCRKHKMFSFKYEESRDTYEIESREFQKIKNRLLFSLTNFGQPLISVVDGNAHNRGELRLQHHFTGVSLRLDHAQDTLRNLHRIWKRPVHLETVVDGRPTLLSYDGSQHTNRQLGRVS